MRYHISLKFIHWLTALIVVFDLFAALDATDEQLDFPIIYASGRSGWAAKSLDAPRENLEPLFQIIREYVPLPNVDPNAPFSMLSTILEADPYLGRILTGRVYSGTAKVNMPVKAINLNGELVESGRLSKIYSFRGIERVAVDTVFAGDIIAIAGLSEASVADTICSPEVSVAIKSTPIDPPTMAVTIRVNDSPLAGTEGTKVTTRMIFDRLIKEAETNVAIKVKETDETDDVNVTKDFDLIIPASQAFFCHQFVWKIVFLVDVNIPMGFVMDV